MSSSSTNNNLNGSITKHTFDESVEFFCMVEKCSGLRYELQKFKECIIAGHYKVSFLRMTKCSDVFVY